MPTRATIRALDGFWASYLGCRREHLHRHRTVVVEHTGSLSGYQGVFAFRRGPACVVSTPAEVLEIVSGASRHRAPKDLFDAGFLSSVLEGMVDRVIGPAWYGYADRADFLPTDLRGARLLTELDDAALHHLAEVCTPADWEHSGIQLGRPAIFGCFLDDTLVAAACLTIWEGDQLRIGHVGVVTHPSHRRRGYGRAVVGAITEYALRSGLLPQYRTLRANAPSMAVARVLGYQEYAASIAVRLLSNPTGKAAGNEVL